jgi:hypothetical protein
MTLKELIATMSEKDIKWLHLNLIKPSEDACWEWQRCRSKDGYGQLKIARITCYTHRIMYYLENPQASEDLCVLHKCNNRACGNPKHLFLGTKTDNHNDKVAKGRANHNKGKSYLSNKQITEIIKLKKNGISQNVIGKMFNVDGSYVSRIYNGRRLASLTEKLGTPSATDNLAS